MKICPSCGGMKMHHTDHAPGGFETCSTCSGQGVILKYRLFGNSKMIFQSDNSSEVWEKIGKLPFGSLYEVLDESDGYISEFIPF